MDLTATSPKNDAYSPGSFRSWLAVSGGLLGAFMAILDIQITNSSMLEIQGGLGATLDEASWISTSYLVAEMIGIPLSGWLSNGLSTRRYLLISSSAFIFASILCSFAWDLNSMIVFRALQGFFGGALIPLAFKLILEHLPSDKRSIGMSLFGLTAIFAPSIGPSLGGWLTNSFGWHYLFYINIPPSLISMALLAYGLQKGPIDWLQLRRVDIAGIITMMLGMGCLEVVLEEGNSEQWFDSSFIQNLTIIAIINITLFIVIELRKKHPLVNLRLLGNRNFFLASVSYFLLGLGLFGAIYLIPLYLAEMQQYNPLQIGQVIMWMGFPQLLVLPWLPLLIKRIDARYLAAFGFLLFGLSFYMNSHMSIDYAGEQLIPSLLVRAMGQPFILVPISVLATAHIAANQNADASTLLNVIRNLGGAFGIAMVSTLTDSFARENLAYMRENITAVSVTGKNYLTDTSNSLIHSGLDPTTAATEAKVMLLQALSQQAHILAFNKVFFMLSLLLFISAMAVLLIKKVPTAG